MLLKAVDVKKQNHSRRFHSGKYFSRSSVVTKPCVSKPYVGSGGAFGGPGGGLGGPGGGCPGSSDSVKVVAKPLLRLLERQPPPGPPKPPPGPPKAPPEPTWGLLTWGSVTTDKTLSKEPTGEKKGSGSFLLIDSFFLFFRPWTPE